MANYVGPYSPSYYDSMFGAASGQPSAQVVGESYPVDQSTINAYYANTSNPVVPKSENPYVTPTGGGGGSGDVLGDSDTYTEPDMSAQIDSVFSPIMNYLNEAETSVRGAQPGIENQITAGASASLKSAESQKQAGEEKLQYSEEQAGTRKEDALSSARRLYNEMGMGGAQRFGRQSPIGEGFQALLGREFARNRGNVFQGYEDTMRNISMAKSDLVRGYNDIVAQIKLKRDEMIATARQNFEDRLLQIKQNRATAESEKASMNLENLQALRNQIYEINLAVATNKSQLDSYTSNLQNRLDALAGTTSSATGGASSAVSNLLASTNPLVTNAQSAYQVGGTTGGTTYQAPQGAITPRKEDELYQGAW